MKQLKNFQFPIFDGLNATVRFQYFMDAWCMALGQCGGGQIYSSATNMSSCNSLERNYQSLAEKELRKYIYNLYLFQNI